MLESPSMDEFMYYGTTSHTPPWKCKIYDLFSTTKFSTQTFWIASTTFTTTVWILIFTMGIYFNIIRLCCVVTKKRKIGKSLHKTYHSFCNPTYTNWRHPNICLLNFSIWTLIFFSWPGSTVESKLTGIVPLTEMGKKIQLP